MAPGCPLRSRCTRSHGESLEPPALEEAPHARELGLNFGEQPRRPEDRGLAFQRLEEMAAVSFALAVVTYHDAMDEVGFLVLGAEQDRDWLLALESEHTAARPQPELTRRPLEVRDGQRGLRGVRAAAGIVGVDQKRDVVRPAEAITRHQDLSASPCLLASITAMMPTSLSGRPLVDVAAG